jgi:hypothetical protein
MSRKRARIAIVLLRIVIPLFCFAVLADITWLIFTSFGLLFVALAIPNHLCPYCGQFLGPRYFDFGIHWSKPDEGYCRHCGSLLKYDDQK